MYSFASKITSRGYHVCRNSTWQNAKPGHKLKMERQTNKLSKSVDPYVCAIKIKLQFFDTWLTVGHILREVSLHYYFFMEGGNITRHLISKTYKVSPIPTDGLQVPLLLTFSFKSERIFKVMKSFVNDLYDYDYTGEQAEINEEESGDDEEIDTKLTGEENATNENNKIVIEID